MLLQFTFNTPHDDDAKRYEALSRKMIESVRFPPPATATTESSAAEFASFGLRLDVPKNWTRDPIERIPWVFTWLFPNPQNPVYAATFSIELERADGRSLSAFCDSIAAETKSQVVGPMRAAGEDGILLRATSEHEFKVVEQLCIKHGSFFYIFATRPARRNLYQMPSVTRFVKR